ncbi:serine/threonine protein kinase [Amycolatopsis benzoatilytica]|uniref:serine/threonine protein kinase n=1 Tax=Amycolatopsis benzoatilytica TaxID=346045 RepID=UPI00054E7095|nr:protein kinase [Amycolatopsis benzoatilytica]
MRIETAAVDLLAHGPIATLYAIRAAGEAVKVFPGPFDRDTSAGVERERKALASAGPVPSILPALGVVECPDGRAGLRMELCAGSLGGLLASGARLPGEVVLTLGTAVASALAGAHRAGVLHGGVTPENVLYRASGDFVLADFGQTLRRRFPRDPMRSVEYTAPETLRDDTISAASDLYGLGAVLYTALTGAPPFPRRTGQQPGERILQVLREPVAPIRGADVPAGLSDVVTRLLAKDPDDRPADAAAVVALLENLRRGVVPASAAAEPVAPEPAPVDEPEPEAADVEFDDFAEIPPATPPSVAAPAPAAGVETPPNPSGRTLIRTFGGPAESAQRTGSPARRRAALSAGAGLVVAGLAVLPFFTRPDEVVGHPFPVALAAPPADTAAGPVPDVHLALAQPADLGNRVRLTWQADGDLDFAVVVAGERIDTMVLVAHRQHAMEVPIDPARRYCFQIRATDGKHIYSSTPVPIRGGHCTL